ncbi:MAG: GNAT family N-acetyltransferase [Bacteriovorax sp.]
MKTKTISVKSFYGSEIIPLVLELAKLRIAVFRDFPYLYEGNLDYEKNYLKVYTDSKKSVLVAAFDGERLIGAATALPLIDEADYVKEPFIKAKMNLEDIYYFGESVLLKEYRGLGIGHQFFDGRENAAVKFGFHVTCFCGVKRPIDHPMRPKDFTPLDEFWKKRGYEKQEQLTSEFSWPDIGELGETKKTMIYWLRNLK